MLQILHIPLRKQQLVTDPILLSDVFRVINWIERKKLNILRELLPQDEWEELEANLLPSDIEAAMEEETLSGQHEDQKEGKKSGAWVPPESFKRRTEKYWVEPEAIVSVKVLLAKRIPILIFGKDAKKEDKKRMKRFGMRMKPLWSDFSGQVASPSNATEEDRIRWKVSSLVSSVYYDNENFDIYNERIHKLHNSTLVRTRWYGKVEPTKNIFMERKIHKDKEVSNEESIKERFEIPLSQVQAFCKGEWNLDRAELEKKMKLQKKVEYAMNLSKDIQQFFVQRKLVPTVRTMYMRTAFQSQHSNDFRSTFDTHLCFCKEFRDINREPPYKPLHDENFDARSEVHMFPKAVLELKYAMSETKPLKWIVELLNLPGVTVTPSRFSKFIHASAIAFPQVLKVQEPAWLSMNIENQETPGEEQEEIDHLAAIQNMSKKQDRSQNDLSILIEEPYTTQLAQEVLPRKKSRLLPTSAITLKSMRISEKGNQVDVDSLEDEEVNMSKGWIKATMVNERTLLNWISPIILLLTVAVTLMGYGDQTMQVFGVLIVIISIIFSLYALSKFIRRRSAIGVKGGFGIDDWIGPSVLIMLMTVAMAATVVITFVSNSNWFKFETIIGKDLHLDSKDFQITLPSDKFSGRSREFGWQTYFAKIRTIQPRVSFSLGKGFTPIICHEIVAQLANNNQRKEIAELKAREYLVFNTNTSKYERGKKEIEVILKYKYIEPEAFIAPHINFRAPYVFDREVGREEEVVCNGGAVATPTRLFFHSSKVFLRVPNSFRLTHEIPGTLLQYYIDSGFTEESIKQTDQIFMYTVQLPMMLNDQNITNPGISFKYKSESEMISGISTYAPADQVSFTFNLDKDQFASTLRYANDLHSVLCKDAQQPQ